MSGDKVQLPDFLLAELYKSSLVVLDDVEGRALATVAAPRPPAPDPVVAAAVPPSPVVNVRSTPAVEVPVPAVIPANVPASEKLSFLGNNGKNILILVSDPASVHLNDEALQFLSAILGACKLNLGDVAIINAQHNDISYDYLKSQMQPKQLLLFGIDTRLVQLPFVVPQYQVQAYDKCQFLLAPPLSAMLGNSQEAKLEKSKLWLSLKKIFGL
ncbi:hypothetical protein [Sediminibacterium ginsengisoli]|uniref:DNA polymerase III, psi subunit n=1 Tax=Sediminibacterium ginsengisoli TaxID=413434 RepID=A0A1T4PX82_9BACT|nr:hypothetical protein [Sediminibacterium ginsengisoli]SJZ96095.1 hypothetical protein SAMN04488132_1079 [Sediminibacterium ginsengisoli]